MTGDGSHSVELPGRGITYHSRHGAIQESRHIFLQLGYRVVRSDGPVRILELGFGTGLNAFLTFLEGMPVRYHALEPDPLPLELVTALNYPGLLGRGDLFLALHEAPWGEWAPLGPLGHLKKTKMSILDFEAEQGYDLIYYDAFAPDFQPELWTPALLKRLYSMLRPGGIWVSYCSKGEVRRGLAGAGFSVEKLPGPPGKREVLRAVRPLHS